MGRQYAGILGLLACGLTLLRGIAGGSSPEPTLIAAICGLFGFALIGLLTGHVAEYLVRNAVQTKFEAALAEWEQNRAKSV